MMAMIRGFAAVSLIYCVDAETQVPSSRDTSCEHYCWRNDRPHQPRFMRVIRSLVQQGGCMWTNVHSCPWQPLDGTAGRATPDMKGYHCCCVARTREQQACGGGDVIPMGPYPYAEKTYSSLKMHPTDRRIDVAYPADTGAGCRTGTRARRRIRPSGAGRAAARV